MSLVRCIFTERDTGHTFTMSTRKKTPTFSSISGEKKVVVLFFGGNLVNLLSSMASMASDDIWAGLC